MKGLNRFAAVTATAILLSSTALAIFSAPVAATTGQDSPATAVDGLSGPFGSAMGGPTVYVQPGPPVVEDWYKVSVVDGQMLQISFFNDAGSRVTVYHPEGCSATGCTNELTNRQVPNNCAGLGLGGIDQLINKTEIVYIKITPSGTGGTTQYYNLAVRTYFISEIRSGGSVTPTPSNESIHGWAVPTLFSGSCSGGGGASIYLPMRYVTDYYWINVSDISGPNHQNYRVSLSWTCSTAIFDLFLYQRFDPQNNNMELLNHSLGYQRREVRTAMSTIPDQLEFAPVLYDGRYLAEIDALENGSFVFPTANAVYSYTLSVTSSGGYQRDSNDQRENATWVNTTQKVTGRIDGRDDSGDWYRFPLYVGDQVSVGVSLFRELNQITTWGQRYRVLVYDPNGTAIHDSINWGFAGGNYFFNPYLSVPSFAAAMNGTYSLLLMTADGALYNLPGNNQPQLAGYVGRSWADYEINFALPNRRPVQLQDPLPDVIMNEDGSGSINLGALFMDPEGKFGYPTFSVGTNLNFTFALDPTGKNLTVTPKPDWNGRNTVPIIVRDDVPANALTVNLNLVVDPVNDAPRIFGGAAANWSTVTLPEDTETTVPLRAIFYDIDDIELNFSAGGVSGGHIQVIINNVSKIVTLTPQPNWNGCQNITWTATDPGSLTNDFQTTVCVTPVNDPPRATDSRLDRIQFNEGGEWTVDLSSEFYDLDGDALRYFGVIEDPIVAQYVRINNSLLTQTDPHMRIYVIDSVRADYFTDGPVQVRFYVLDPQNNFDPATGGPVEVSKTTFLQIDNVNDPPVLDDYTPTTDEVALTPWHEGDTITFSVTSVKDADRETQFFYKWFVNGEEVAQEVSPTFVFRTVLDKTRPGQYDQGNYTVSVQVFDAAGAKAVRQPEWTFEVLKTNRKPTVQVLRPTSPTFDEGSFIDFQALAGDEDPEDANLLQTTWQITDAAGHTTEIGTGDHLKKMLDPGSYKVTVKVFDGTDWANSTINLQVNEHKLNTPGFDLAGAAAGIAVAAVLVAGARRRAGKDE